ncbi:MAG: Sugar or nucleoside kinase, ribokinase family [Myxococcales bacterium]|nr:Sugar or nucleoside kinase, ribokinase family [Myxococcales bacterium]
MTDAAIAIYGRTYLDAEVEVAVGSLATGKGKVDTQVRAVLGGFGCNAARALARVMPAGAVHLTTVISRVDLPRLQAEVPPEVVLDPILHDSLAWPPITVIVNPAGECRLLRGRAEEDTVHWTLERVRAQTLSAPLQVLGRVPLSMVRALLARRRGGTRIAWCGGNAIPLDLERELDLLCVNTAEAQRLLETQESSPGKLAQDLAMRANVASAVRLVTGRGRAPAVAAVREQGAVMLHEGPPPAEIGPLEIRQLKGVGDVFAARFLAAACVDSDGQARSTLDVARALTIAAAAATAFIRGADAA